MDHRHDVSDPEHLFFCVVRRIRACLDSVDGTGHWLGEDTLSDLSTKVVWVSVQQLGSFSYGVCLAPESSEILV